jgi:hypothetical protein
MSRSQLDQQMLSVFMWSQFRERLAPLLPDYSQDSTALDSEKQDGVNVGIWSVAVWHILYRWRASCVWYRASIKFTAGSSIHSCYRWQSEWGRWEALKRLSFLFRDCPSQRRRLRILALNWRTVQARSKVDSPLSSTFPASLQLKVLLSEYTHLFLKPVPIGSIPIFPNQ